MYRGLQPAREGWTTVLPCPALSPTASGKVETWRHTKTARQMNEASPAQVEEVSQSDNRSISISTRPARAPGTGNGTASSSKLDECMQAWPGRGSDVSCLSGWSVVLARSFRSSFFLSLRSTPTPTPRHMQGRGRVLEVARKGNHSSRKGHCHCPPIPITTQSERQSQSGQGSRDIVEEAQRATGGGPAWAGPQKKGTWRKRRSEYVHTHPSSPTQSNPGRASFLPFHIHIPCRTGTGSGTGTTLDRVKNEANIRTNVYGNG